MRKIKFFHLTAPQKVLPPNVTDTIVFQTNPGDVFVVAAHIPHIHTSQVIPVQ